MRKLLLKLDVTKFNKEKIEDNSYTNSNGEQVTKKEYPVEVILTDDHKIIKEYDNANLTNVGFVVEGQTKEERQNQTKTPRLSDALEFVDKQSTEVDPSDIPFD